LCGRSLFVSAAQAATFNNAGVSAARARRHAFHFAANLCMFSGFGERVWLRLLVLLDLQREGNYKVSRVDSRSNCRGDITLVWLLICCLWQQRDVSMPFRISDLNFFYHNDENRQVLHPNVEWPMQTCNLHHLTKLLPVSPGHVVSANQIGAPTCSDDVCARWLSGNKSRKPLQVRNLFLMPTSLGTSRGAVLKYTSGVPAVVFGERNYTVRLEVMRMFAKRTGEAGYDGMHGNGCWFWRAVGSGIWIDSSSSWGLGTKPLKMGGELREFKWGQEWRLGQNI